MDIQLTFNVLAFGSILASLLLFCSCTEKGNDLSATQELPETSRLVHDAVTGLSPVFQGPSFQVVDADRYWTWIDTTFSIEKSTGEHLVNNVQDLEEIDELITLFEEVTARVGDNPEELSEKQKKEFSFLTHTYLSTLYQRKYGINESNELLDRSITHQENALRYLEGEASYREDKAFPHRALLSMKCSRQPDRKCMEDYLEAVNTYDGLPFGTYPEWFVAQLLSDIHRHFLVNEADSSLRNEVETHIMELVGRADPVGVSAALTLTKFYLAEGRYDRAGSLIENPSTDIESLPPELRQNWKQMEEAYESHSEHE